MSAINEQQREDLFNKIMYLAKNKLPPAQVTLLGEFIKHYYASVAVEDLEYRDIIDLYGAMLSHWEMIYVRKPGETHLRIYNPHFEQNGWQSTHTIIEIAHDDMPFLVDSIQNELNRRKITTHLIFHAGGVKVKRNEKNHLTQIFPMGSMEENCLVEAPIFIEIDRITDPNILEDLRNSLMRILHDVELAVQDWERMYAKVAELMAHLIKKPPPLDAKEVEESIAFLDWLLHENFIFLGYREYELDKENGDLVLKVIPGTGLGVLHDAIPGKISRHFSEMPPEARSVALSKSMLIIAKSSITSTVHRAVNTDIVGVKVFDDQGNVIGEKRFVGLYTSTAYHSRPYSIPMLREKVREVMVSSKLSPKGHGGKALLNILENLPRDDLFQATPAELLDLSMGIFHLQERRIIKLFVRKDIYGRFISCLIYIPRDQYNTDLRQNMQDILQEAFNAEEISYNTLIGESILGRVHFMIKINPHVEVDYDVNEIEAKLIEVSRLWHEELKDELVDFYGEERGIEVAMRYQKAFPAGYRENYNVRSAVYDIDHIETLADEQDLAMAFLNPLEEKKNFLRLKLYHLATPIPLFDALPILENMGLRVLSEQPYKVNRKDGLCAWIHDFTLTFHESLEFEIDQIRDIFRSAFANVWFARAENDGLNRLVLSAKLSWREISILRAYSRYFAQIGSTYSQDYIASTLDKHANISSLLIAFFKYRFDPMFDGNRREICNTINQQIMQALDAVASLDEDKILKRLMDLMLATLRTNYFQTDNSGKEKECLSLKFDPQLIMDMPLPRPAYEIWIYSPRVEGVHLRSSKVARGGIRWSDRHDFRTEVLGLMKAQKVKNAVIVPSGAKGGFVPKQLPNGDNREAIMAEAITSYKLFISGLLDITDNLVDGKITYPPHVVRHDDDDPYLVVAADKGTATFSNYANEVAESYNFWLGDAFASGGNTGYDHKKMGITARGAWESLERHFREMNFNIKENDFTVIGIGDMAGDVFGNGMLLSERIKLLAAFNHAHIFIDPNPNSAVSFAERQRLFNLPRSSWEDYNPELISAGGGVFKRSAKFITLTPEIKAVFNINQDRIEPNQLIRSILMADVDLLWNGGIGTFVKARVELNEQVGDKTNDAIRINGDELRTKVVVEGGNLGLTQLGRVEYAINGGRIFTDFIDNSAGVDCSDHEVNLKILLNDLVTNGDMTLKQRNQLLAEMTDDVASLVLKNNYWQTQAISIASKQADKNHDLYRRYISTLETAKKLDRELEFLPNDKKLAERKGLGQSLTAPELSVLLAYSKINLKEDILKSDVPEDPYLSRIISTSFPPIIRDEYYEAMIHHKLRREIIATQLSNVIINKMSLTFINRVQEETGASVAMVVRAYTIAHEIFNISALWESIEALDYQVSTNIQCEMMLLVGRLVRRATRWFLRNHRDLSNIEELINRYMYGVAKLEENLHLLLRGTNKKVFEGLVSIYREGHVPEKIAKQVAGTAAMFSVLDIISACREHQLDPRMYAQIYFILGAKLELGWLRANIIAQTEDSHWDALAKAGLRDDIDWQQRQLTVNILMFEPQAENAEELVTRWIDKHKDLVRRWKSMIIELRGSNVVEFVKYAVAIRELVDLNQASKQSLLQEEQIS